CASSPGRPVGTADSPVVVGMGPSVVQPAAAAAMMASAMRVMEGRHATARGWEPRALATFDRAVSPACRTASAATPGSRSALRDGDAGDRDRLGGPIARPARHALDLLHQLDLLTAAEDRVLVVEPRRRALGDEELTAVGPRPGVRHRQRARLHREAVVDLVA